MTTSPTFPKKILLSTDFSPRSDRALDRSYDYARLWGASLTVVHAIEFESYHRDVPAWRRGADKVTVLKEKCIADLTQDGITPQVVVEAGEPHELVLKTAQSVGSDLIVTGIAQNEPFGRKVLGNTVSTLARKAPCPLLVVKKRLKGPYRFVVVAVDNSDFSKKALHYALRTFPDLPVTALHAVVVPFRSRASNPDEYVWQLCNGAKEEMGTFLDSALDPADRDRVSLVVDEGRESWLVADYVTDTGADLVVVGTHGTTGLLDKMLGSVASDILRDVPCDVLVVR